MKVKIVSIKTDLRGTEVSKNHYLRGAMKKIEKLSDNSSQFNTLFNLA
jgi:hypothetical protein